MQVLYKSTRGKEQAVTASMAILKGLSEDAGNTDLLDKAKLEKRIASLEGERKSFNISILL